MERPRLAERIDRALEAGPLLVTAGAGFGKTTVLEQALDGTAAWVPVTTAERDPGALVLRIVAGISRAVPGATGALGEALALPTGPIDPQAAARRLADVLDRALRQPLVIVIDDGERLEGADASCALLGALVAARPAPVRLAIASRRPLAIKAAKARAGGTLTDLAANELLFTAAECAEVLRRHLGREPDGEQVHVILSATGGARRGAVVHRAEREQDRTDHDRGRCARGGGTRRTARGARSARSARPRRPAGAGGLPGTGAGAQRAGPLRADRSCAGHAVRDAAGRARALPADRDRHRRGPARLQQRHGPPALKAGARRNDRREACLVAICYTTAMSTMPTRVDRGLFEAARAAGELNSRSAAQQLAHWARLGREMEASPAVTQDTIARVLAGQELYDDLPDPGQAVVRVAWDDRVAATLAELDFTDRLRAAGKPWPEADEDGSLVMRGVTTQAR